MDCNKVLNTFMTIFFFFAFQAKLNQQKKSCIRCSFVHDQVWAAQFQGKTDILKESAGVHLHTNYRVYSPPPLVAAHR